MWIDLPNALNKMLSDDLIVKPESEDVAGTVLR